MPLDYQDYKICAIAVPDSEKTDSISSESFVAGSATSAVPRSFAVLAKVSQLWTNGSTISYLFLGGTENQQRKVNETIGEWTKYANITFSKVNENADVRITFDPKLGSWSYVGTAVQSIPKGQATMNLGWVKDTPTTSDDEHGVILHEWGHTLGLMHEHQSPARGRKITLDEHKVYAYYMKTQGWSKATVKSQIIDVYNTQDVSNYSEVDTKSIMIYFMPAALNKQGIEIDVVDKLSDLDKAYMVINYPRRPGAELQDPVWTLDHALEVAQVDSATTESIKGSMGENPDADKIRKDFTAYVVKARGPSPAHGLDSRGVSGDTWCGRGSDHQPATETSEGTQRGFILEDHLWTPNSTIKYGFLLGNKQDTEATQFRQDRVRKALDDYEKYVSLKFELVDTSSLNFEKEDDRKKCSVRIAFAAPVKGTDGTTNYGWSFYGNEALTAAHDPQDTPQYGGAKWATVFLGAQPSDEKDSVNFDMANRTLYHELGHMLGLYHEHESPNSLSGSSGGVSKYMVSTLYDPDSVMLYEDLPYKDGSGRTSQLNIRPSLTDNFLLSLLYPDKGSDTSNFSAALNAFNFTNAKDLLEKAARALASDADPGLLTALRLSIASDLNSKSRLAIAPVLKMPQQAAQGPTGGGTQMPGFSGELIECLKSTFNPGGNQMFALQHPGRFLQQSEYAWDTSNAGIYGQFVKPIAVNESEFRLVDQLYDLQDIVGGPNGTNLSIVYEQLLNNLFPKFVSNGLVSQQEQIRNWLLKEVPETRWVQDIMERQKTREKSLADTFAKSMGIKPTDADSSGSTDSGQAGSNPSFALVPGKMFDISSKDKTETLNRIELSEILMSEYLYAKQDWELERDALIAKASEPEMGTPESKEALDALTRKLAHITATRQAQLASKYADAVVRGHSHNVREYMGYLDIASPAEALQNAKDSLRESAMSSLNGAMKVYPVQLTPIDWFEGLSTSFKLEDLTSDPETIRTQIDAKSQQLDALNSQMVSLEMGATGDATALQDKVEKAQAALDSAQSKLAETYASNVIQMAKTCLDEYGKVDIPTVSKKVKMAEAALKDLPDQMAAVRTAQDTLTASSRALSQLMAAHALAEATDTRQQQQQIRLQIQSLTEDINELQTRWQVLTAKTGGLNIIKTDKSKDTLDPAQPLELPEELTSGGSRWETVRLTSTSSSRLSASSASASAKSEQWSVNLWLASGGGSSSSESGRSAATTSISNDTVDIAFRGTLVTVDRGGWFQPQFFKQSKAFYKVNEDISWVDGKNGVKGVLPGFPVAFLIVKDVVIRITHSGTSTDDMKSFDKAQSESSGGVLCFSYSRSESSSSSATNSSFQAYSNGFVIKIPGPQILGYMIEKTGEDQATLMPKTLPSDFLVPEDKYDSALKGVTAPSEPAHAVTKPTISEDKLRDVMSKMLKERMDEMISQITAEK